MSSANALNISHPTCMRCLHKSIDLLFHCFKWNSTLFVIAYENAARRSSFIIHHWLLVLYKIFILWALEKHVPMQNMSSSIHEISIQQNHKIWKRDDLHKALECAEKKTITYFDEREKNNNNNNKHICRNSNINIAGAPKEKESVSVSFVRFYYLWMVLLLSIVEFIPWPEQIKKKEKKLNNFLSFSTSDPIVVMSTAQNSWQWKYSA